MNESLKTIKFYYEYIPLGHDDLLKKLKDKTFKMENVKDLAINTIRIRRLYNDLLDRQKYQGEDSLGNDHQRIVIDTVVFSPTDQEMVILRNTSEEIIEIH